MSAQAERKRLISPGVLDAVEEWPVERVREMRDACRSSEVRISYERRVAQGRLDIARAELARRTQPRTAEESAGEGEGSGRDLVDALPGILADRPSGAPKADRALAFIDLDDDMDDDVDELPAILDLPDLADEDVAAIITTLQDAERELSEQRRTLLDNLDRLQEELVARYRDGRADVQTVMDADPADAADVGDHPQR